EEQELERTPRGEQVVPVADDQLDVRERGEAVAREGRAFLVPLDGDEGRTGVGNRSRSLAERRTNLGSAPPSRQHAQQLLDLGQRRAARGQSSASGNARCRRGGTRKFCRCVVRSTSLKPCPR